VYLPTGGSLVMKEGAIVGEMTGDDITEANIAKIIA
jgi:hypothetical protein